MHDTLDDLPVSKQRFSDRTVRTKHQPDLFETWDLKKRQLLLTLMVVTMGCGRVVLLSIDKHCNLAFDDQQWTPHIAD